MAVIPAADRSGILPRASRSDTCSESPAESPRGTPSPAPRHRRRSHRRVRLLDIDPARNALRVGAQRTRHASPSSPPARELPELDCSWADPTDAGLRRLCRPPPTRGRCSSPGFSARHGRRRERAPGQQLSSTPSATALSAALMPRPYAASTSTKSSTYSALQRRHRRQPLARTRRALLLIHQLGRRDEVAGIVREHGAVVVRPELRAVAPCPRERDDVVDLHQHRGVRARDEVDRRAVVRIDQQSAEHLAVVRARLEHRVQQVASERVVAGVAAVSIDVQPGLAEPPPVIGHVGLPSTIASPSSFSRARAAGSAGDGVRGAAWPASRPRTTPTTSAARITSTHTIHARPPPVGRAGPPVKRRAAFPRTPCY